MCPNVGLNKGMKMIFSHQRKQDIKIMSIFVIFGLILIQVKNVNGLDAICVPGVTKYASSEGPGFYYECQPGDDEPILKECPGGARWDRKSMLCVKRVGSPLVRQAQGEGGGPNEEEKPEILFQPVLGRTVMLGDLYDARRDLPLNGYSLWNEHVVRGNKLIENKFYSNTHFFFEKSQDDRLAKLDVDASLELNFLGGLIHVSGSAQYLKDQKETLNHIRFNMMYEATTRTETLPMSLRQDKTYPHICADIMSNTKTGPTHVISSVEYGMKAIFMFEKFVSRNESKEEIGGSLSVIIKQIPTFKIEGHATINVEGTINKTKETMDVKMYGDFIVDHSPTTYEGAARVYEELPTYLGDKATNYSESSPVKIMLTPIGQYCDGDALVLAGISVELMSKATEIMAELAKVMLHVRTLESTYLAHKFLDISSLLKLFRIELNVFTLEIKTKLRDIIPAMRGGGGEEQLAILLFNYTKSSFQYDHAIRFLKERERELNTIHALFNDNSIKKYGDIKIGDFTSANIAQALLHKTYIFIYKFSVFSNINVTKEYLNSRIITEDTWYNNYTLIGLAGFNWREFKTFVNINKDSSLDQEFFIQGSRLGDKLTQISVYENGIQLTPDFKVPMSPPRPKVVAKSYNSVTLLLANIAEVMGNEFVTDILVKYGTELDLESNYKTVTINTKVNQLWIKGKNKRCWRPCGNKGGSCEKFCGTGGYCCRKGFHDCPDGAQEVASGFYSCVIDSANKTGQILTTIEIPMEVEVNIDDTSQVVPVTHTFKTAYQTSFGRGRDSKALIGVRPLPSSPPKLKSVDHIDSTSVKLKWEEPGVISGQLILSGYKVDVTNVNVFKTSDQEMTITDLKPATKYTVYLEAWFSNWMIVGQTAEANFYTIPNQPEKPSAVKIGKHDVNLQLDPKEELVISPDAVFKRYNVIFYKVYKNMTKIPGTQYEMNFQNSEIEISSLMQGKQYNFEYKIVTSKGSSLSSPPLLVETHYNKTELETINQAIEDTSDEMRNLINTEISIISNQISDFKLAPLGTITAWVNNPATKSGSMAPLPEGWQRCDGSIIPQPSIWAGLHTPDLNGGRRFLRGGKDHDMLNIEEDTTKIPEHTHIDNGHTHTAISQADPHNHPYKDTYVFWKVHEDKAIAQGNSLGADYFTDDKKTSDTTVTIKTTIHKSTCNMGGVKNLGNFAKETRPKNMNVIYIIKIL